MHDLIDLLIEDDRWQTYDIEPLAEKAVTVALKFADIADADYEVTVLACNDARIAELNEEFRGKTSPTNVLSWPTYELAPETPGDPPEKDIPIEQFGPTSLGDIAISYEKVTEEAQNSHIDVQNHIIHLLIHATLHLLGYDHQTDPDANRMEQLEVAALASLGIASPY